MKTNHLAPLVAISKSFCQKGWVVGTSGNFSVVLRHHPLSLAITPSGVDKQFLSRSQILTIDAKGNTRKNRSLLKPSAESLVHIAVVQATGASAVLHTHSTWSTILSSLYETKRSFTLEGYEMLKGLSGNDTHEHQESVPILENTQDMGELSRATLALLKENPRTHGFLVRRHGLYTWGKDLLEAKRHVEIFEFLFEITGRLELGVKGTQHGVT